VTCVISAFLEAQNARETDIYRSGRISENYIHSNISAMMHHRYHPPISLLKYEQPCIS
jgi:hypothetical protein